MRERERGAHRAWGKVPWLWYMKKRETNLEQRLQEGEQSSCKTAEFRARVEVGMVMAILIVANSEKDFPHSLRKRNDARFYGLGSIRARAIHP